MALLSINQTSFLGNDVMQLGLVQRLDTGSADCSPSAATAAATALAAANVSAVIGFGCSDGAKVASPPLAAKQIPLVSFEATSTHLSNSSAFPYFLRVVSADSAQASVIAAIVAKYEWANIGLLATLTDYVRVIVACCRFTSFCRVNRARVRCKPR